MLIGILTGIQSPETALKIIENEKSNIDSFLHMVDNAKPENELPKEIFDGSLDNLDITFKYGISKIFNMHGFLDQLKPSIKEDMVVHILKNYYIRFRNFFWCEQLDFMSNERFIARILSAMHPTVFLPGKIIIHRGESVEYLYLIEKGYVYVTNDFQDIEKVDSIGIDESQALSIMPP